MARVQPFHVVVGVFAIVIAALVGIIKTSDLINGEIEQRRVHLGHGREEDQALIADICSDMNIASKYPPVVAAECDPARDRLRMNLDDMARRQVLEAWGVGGWVSYHIWTILLYFVVLALALFLATAYWWAGRALERLREPLLARTMNKKRE